MSTRATSISCLLPVKNGEDYLGGLIPAILGMLEQGDEVVIVNDGSTDETSKIIESHMLKDKRIKLIETDGIGLVSALNLGISESNNPWIARFDVDDVFDPSRLSVQRLLISDSIAVVFSDYSITSQSGYHLGTIHSAISARATLLSLASAQRTPHPVALINRDLLLASGGYLHEDYPAEDLGLWFRLSGFGELVSSPHTLLRYRLNRNSVSGLNREKQLTKKDQLIHAWPYWNDVYNTCLSSFTETKALYLNSEGGFERILLHLRDLKIVSNSLSEPMRLSRLVKEIDFCTKVGLIRAGIKLAFWGSVRKAYRLFQKKYRFTAILKR